MELIYNEEKQAWEEKKEPYTVVEVETKEELEYLEKALEFYKAHQWISVKDRLPDKFISVLGFMTEAGDFPPVRECFIVSGKDDYSEKEFYFPALGECHPVSHWREMPEPPERDGD